jgi:hypothetical protein
MRRTLATVGLLSVLAAGCGGDDSTAAPYGTAGTGGGADAAAGAGGDAGAAGSGGAGTGGSSGAGTGGAGQGGAAGGDAGNVDAGPPVTVTGTCLEFTLSDGGSVPAISGMEVCVHEHSEIPCALTDSSGLFVLAGVPASSELLLSFEKAGYLPVLRTITSGTAPMDIGAIQYPTTVIADLFAQVVGITIEPEKGHVLSLAFQGAPTTFVGQDGVSSAMTPASGSGPFYADETGFPDQTLTATSSRGFALFGNVDPGEVEIEMTHPTRACTRYVQATWAGSTPTASRVPVVAGYLVGGSNLQCAP